VTTTRADAIAAFAAVLERVCVGSPTSGAQRLLHAWRVLRPQLDDTQATPLNLVPTQRHAFTTALAALDAFEIEVDPREVFAVILINRDQPLAEADVLVRVFDPPTPEVAAVLMAAAAQYGAHLRPQ
jgi:hypothetical protein